jgi:hypothetical protein
VPPWRVQFFQSGYAALTFRHVSSLIPALFSNLLSCCRPDVPPWRVRFFQCGNAALIFRHCTPLTSALFPSLLICCRPDVPLWRVQFFQCGYAAVSGWPGWRTLVTSQGGSQAWVDMPGGGPDAFLSDYAKGGELFGCLQCMVWLAGVITCNCRSWGESQW